MTSRTSAFDVQCEEWAIRYRELEGNDLSKTLMTRAGRLGSLLCDDRAIARITWEQTRVEMIEDSIQHHTNRLLNQLAEKMAGAIPSQGSEGIKVDKHYPQISDADAFFDDYPECIRAGLGQHSYEKESSSEEEEEKARGTKKNRQPSRQHQGSCSSLSRGRSATTAPPLSAHERRQPLYGSDTPHSTFEYAAISRPEIQPSSWEDHAAPSWNNQQQALSPSNHPSRCPNTPWEKHTKQQNPFFTAREMAQVMGDGEPSTRGDYIQCSDYQRPQPQDEATLGGPSIPDSLRRKFQPPKRMPEPVNSHEQRKSSGLAPSAKGGVQAVNAPSSSGGRSLEDELPEELQHLDKELVKKIEHEIMESGDTVTFNDIAGLEDAKQTVQEVVCWPMKRPDLFTGLRRAPNGLLLYGPPGTGKTLIGKAIAHESGATFFSISSSSLTSKWIGEGEKMVKTLFAVAAYREPAVVFIDEIDSLLTQRTATENEASRRIKTEFLVQLDGTGTSGQGRVLVIGATNKPQELDEAARRRFTKRLYIPLPVESDRRILLNVMLKKNNHELTNQDIDRLARETKGFSGADLKALCTDAAMGPIRQLGPRALEVEVHDVPPITFKHFKRSLKGTKPSVALSDLVQYEEWDTVYGSKRATDDDDDDDEEEERNG